MPDPRSATPRTDTVLADPRLQEAAGRLGRDLVKRVVSTTLDRCRAGEVAPADVVDARRRLAACAPTALRRVVNATGVVVHTNLGRAPLSAAAVQALGVVAGTDGRRARPGDRETREARSLGDGCAGGGRARRRRRARREQRRRGACPRHLCPGGGSRDRRRAAASSSRSVTGSGSRSCWSRWVPGCARSARRTGSGWPTTPTRSARTPRSCSRCIRRTSWSRASLLGRDRGPRQPARPRGRGHRLGPARATTPGCPTSRVPLRCSAPAPTSSRRPGTSCSAARSAD